MKDLLTEIFGDFKESFSDSVDKAKAIFNFVKTAMFVFSIFSFVTFSVFTYIAFRKNDEYPFFAQLTLWALAIYFVFLIVLLVTNFVVKKNPHRMRNLKMSLTVMKNLLKFFNLVLAIIVMVSASTTGFWDTAGKAFMIVVSGFMIFFNILFVIVRLRWAKRKEQKQAGKQGKPCYEDGECVLEELPTQKSRRE